LKSANVAPFLFTTILYTGFPPLTYGTPSVVDRATADLLYKKLATSGVQFNYSQGNCHNRAHMLCLLLVSYGIVPGKIWAFAPGIFSVDDPTLISILDKNHISPQGKIEWGYHVVPFLHIEEDGRLETVVFDHSLFKDGLVPYSQWLEKLHIPNLLCIEMDWEWYLYNSLPWNLGELYKAFMGPSDLHFPDLSIQMPFDYPTDMPMHDFFMYESESKYNHWLEKGLAIDDTAYSFYKNEIQPFKNSPSYQSILEDYKLLVGVINNFETVFRDYAQNGEVDMLFQNRHTEIIKKYRKVYNENLVKWLTVTAKLNTDN
jgi:hypothetical protein